LKHLIMGTAGHIDHGKTALTRALTGIDCDTHKEEKARGITINLGFAHLDLSSGLSIGVVDVPGHKTFVHTMVGGASGIDFVLMVVAADEGVMPQTREHLQIMEVLGIRKGLIALTRIDLAQSDIIDIAEEEIRELVQGTFLEEASIVRVSSVTGEGIDLLKDSIAATASGIENRPVGGIFRMFIDRIFTVSGFGTVVTGSVISGSLRVGDKTYLLPGSKELRVRRLERHGEEVDQVVAGDRASINLVGLNREDFKRGMIVSDHLLRDTTIVDAKLHLFEHSRSIGLWHQVIFHSGTYEHQAKVHLIDRDQLSGGETALVQIRLDTRCVVRHGDRFVIRNSTGDITLGGGEIIDAAPLHHRRRPAKLVKSMRQIAEGQLVELIASEVRKRFRPIGHTEIADILNVAPDEIQKEITRSLPDDIILYSAEKEILLIVKSEHDRLQKQLIKKLTAFHKRHPLEEKGQTVKELIGILGIDHSSRTNKILRLMLEKLKSKGELKQVGQTWALSGHSVEMGPEMEQRIKFVETFLSDCGMQTPLMSELIRKAKRQRIDEIEMRQILRYLVEKHWAYFIDNEYLHASVVDRCRKALLQMLGKRQKGITVAEFRDLVGGNRKICLLLLGVYDREGVTRREGDLRVLTDEGRTALRT